MRRSLIAVLFCVPVWAQDPPEDPQALHKLLGEVHELRMAIDRSTLLGARTQIALQRMQIQESRTNRLAQEYDSTHRQAEELAGQKTRLAAQLQGAEERGASAGDNAVRREMEDHAKQLKASIEVVGGQEQRLRAREAELASQLQLEQNRLQDLYSRVDEMERALDNAIRQIGGKQ